MTPVIVHEGTAAVILAQPHSGTFVPGEIEARLNSRGRELLDTDWHVDRLYEDLLPEASIVRANFHRYVIDANRDPSGVSLYPGQNTTGLVPLVTFDEQPVWAEPPTDEEIEARRRDYHSPYHAALSHEIERVKARHGVAILYDCHSIRSRLPFLFEGELPDLNIGTNNGETCAHAIEEAATDICAQSDFSCVLNGRFRGGWTTRHYGKPRTGVHAIQMEIAQHCYLETEAPPFAYADGKADELRKTLRQILERINALALSGELEGDGS